MLPSLLTALLDAQSIGHALYRLTGPTGIHGLYMNPVGLALRGVTAEQFAAGDLIGRTRRQGNAAAADAYLRVARTGESIRSMLVTDDHGGRRRVYDVDAVRITSGPDSFNSQEADRWLLHLAFRDVTHDLDGRRRLERTAADLEVLARTDPLTGLLNRRGWQPELAAAVRRAGAGPGDALCVAIADLDRFKDYNDRHGHPAGDRLLRGLADAWVGALTPGQHLARLGGEEFAVLLPLPLPQAAEACERLRLLVPGQQTVSVGLTRWTPGELPEATLGRADAALYAAKHQGRDRVAALVAP